MLCSSGRRQSSHCYGINTSSRPCTLVTPQPLPRVTKTRANSSNVQPQNMCSSEQRGSETGGRGGQDPLSASNGLFSPPQVGHFKWRCCKSLRRFITVSKVDKSQSESEFLEPDGLLEKERHVLMADSSIIDRLQCLWPIHVTCNNDYSLLYKVHILICAGRAAIECR